jgi:hypothetical protein
VAVYKLIDTDEDRDANPEPFGLIRLDGRRRPAFFTLQQAVGRLSGFFHVERERWDEVGQIRLDQDGQTTTVLFARLPYPQLAEVPATSPDAKLVSMWGDEVELNSENGLYRIELSPALCTQPIGDYCMIGGTTYYLIQAADITRPTPTSSPTATAIVLPTATASLTPSSTPTENALVSSSSGPVITPAAKSTPTSNPQPRQSPEISPTPVPPAGRSDSGPSTLLLGVFACGLAFGIFFSWRALIKRVK